MSEPTPLQSGSNSSCSSTLLASYKSYFFSKEPHSLRIPGSLRFLLWCCILTLGVPAVQSLVYDVCATPLESTPSTGNDAKPSLRVHTSAIAGSWYPKDKEGLSKMLKDFESHAALPEGHYENAVAIVAPHAGYVYSGPIAAYGYRALEKRQPKRVIIMGPSHRAYFQGVAIGDYDFYQNPLGEVPVDNEALEILRTCPLFQPHEEACRREHSVEIQIPFLQTIYGEKFPKIVPLIIGQLGEEEYPALVDAIQKIINEHTVVVVSSDFTHYGPNYQYMPFPCDGQVASRLKALDQGAVGYIQRLDRKGFLAYQKQTGTTICGYQPIALLLDLLPKDTEARMLAYGTSGEQTGSYQNSVSYVSVAFVRPGLWQKGSQPTITGGHTTVRKDIHVPQKVTSDALLTPNEKKTLLTIARDTLERCVRGKAVPDPLAGGYNITETLRKNSGAFVTLKKKGMLRGCVGYILPIAPLYESVQKNAVNAAVHDSRFPPVGVEEVTDIHIEISALSEPRKIASHKDIRLGTHGIILKKGFSQAVFLPQVAPEQGWDIEETLRHLSMKAGLRSDAWKDPDTTFEVFTAEVFEEEER